MSVSISQTYNLTRLPLLTKVGYGTVLCIVISPNKVVGALAHCFETLPCQQTSDSTWIRENQKHRNMKGELPGLNLLAHCLRATEQTLNAAKAQVNYLWKDLSPTQQDARAAIEEKSPAPAMLKVRN